jgi:hypothetical protein
MCVRVSFAPVCQSENISKYEIMDGAPVRGESIPIRLFLSPYDLTPTQRAVQNKYSVKYYLNLVLVDEEDRRYFKQQEVTPTHAHTAYTHAAATVHMLILLMAVVSCVAAVVDHLVA